MKSVIAAANTWPLLTCVSLLAAGAAADQPASAQVVSALWGRAGEKWTPQSRLPDFSCAGYRCGETPLPAFPVVKNLKTDYGAKGDGEADDSQAFLDAIRDAPKGVLFIPTAQGSGCATKTWVELEH